MKKTNTLGVDYFEDLYRRDQDPWKFATSSYEALKYARTLEVIAEEPVSRALEVGCSIGVFTRELALWCRGVVATEVAPTALDEARRRCAGAPNIDFRLAGATAEPLGGPFDLVVLSEVLYFWEDQDIAAFAREFERALPPGGRVVLVHWLGETDYPKSGDGAVTSFRSALRGAYVVGAEERTTDYRLDVWRRTG